MERGAMEVQLCALICFVFFQNQVAGINIRIVSPLNNSVGRLEVYYNGEWGTVCDDSFGTVDAIVACRQLGRYHPGFKPHAIQAFGSGSGKIWLDDVGCTGSERSLSDCRHGGWGVHNCGHHEDVGVICDERFTEARLVSVNNHAGTGKLEIYYGGKWGSVCTNGFGTDEATVLCRMLGYLTYGASVSLAYGSGVALLTNVNCQGNELSLSDCPKAWYSNSCNFVGVRCGSYTARLVSQSNELDSGRLEVNYNGQWGTVCRSGFGDEEARVICRMLGYPIHGSQAVTTTGSGSFPVRLNHVKCTGFELSLNDCLYGHWGRYSCPTVGIQWPYVRLAAGDGETHGRFEVFYRSQWGSVMDDGFSNLSASVVCRMLGQPHHKAYFTSGGMYGEGTGPIWLSNVSCQGNESGIGQCSHSGWGSPTNNHSRDVGVVCSYIPVVHLQPSTSHLHVILGNEIRVGCVVDDANPTVTSYEWVHNSEKTNTTNQTMFIIPAAESARGTITCIAKNGIGSGGRATTYIDILYQPMLDCPDVLNLELRASKTVECLVSSNPAPTSDVRGPDGERLESHVTFTESKLHFELTNVTEQYAGLYVVAVRNVMTDYRGATINGSSTDIIIVYVHVQEHHESPSVNMKLVAIVTGCVSAAVILLLIVSMCYLQRRLNANAKRGVQEEQQASDRVGRGITNVVYLRDSHEDEVGVDELHIYEQLHQEHRNTNQNEPVYMNT